ncbi:MAG TPA: diacylglycerol kinase family protein [Sphingobacteriaceae bacterium]
MRKFLMGFTYAFKGMVYAFSTQINFKVHVLFSVMAISLGIYADLARSEWMWIGAVILLVLIVELINTAIEVLVDLVSPDYHPKAGIIKDVSAAAVLLTAFFAILTGAFIFVPKIF